METAKITAAIIHSMRFQRIGTVTKLIRLILECRVEAVNDIVAKSEDIPDASERNKHVFMELKSLDKEMLGLMYEANNKVTYYWRELCLDKRIDFDLVTESLHLLDSNITRECSDIIKGIRPYSSMYSDEYQRLIEAVRDYLDTLSRVESFDDYQKSRQQERDDASKNKGKWRKGWKPYGPTLGSVHGKQLNKAKKYAQEEERLAQVDHHRAAMAEEAKVKANLEVVAEYETEEEPIPVQRRKDPPVEKSGSVYTSASKANTLGDLHGSKLEEAKERLSQQAHHEAAMAEEAEVADEPSPVPETGMRGEAPDAASVDPVEPATSSPEVHVGQEDDEDEAVNQEIARLSS